MNVYLLAAILAGVALMLTTKSASAKGLEYIRQFEKFSPTPYPDFKGYSIGYGHLIKPGENLTRVSREEAEEILKLDVSEVEEVINRLVKVPLSQNQYDALTSLVYNIGIGAFATSTLLKKLNEGDYIGAGNEFPRWKYAGGKVLPSLVTRRAAEHETWSA